MPSDDEAEAAFCGFLQLHISYPHYSLNKKGVLVEFTRPAPNTRQQLELNRLESLFQGKVLKELGRSWFQIHVSPSGMYDSVKISSHRLRNSQ